MNRSATVRISLSVVLSAGLLLGLSAPSQAIRKPDGVSAAGVEQAPSQPGPRETTVAVAEGGRSETISGLAKSESALGEQIKNYVASNPGLFQLRELPSLRVDYVTLTRAPGGDTAYVRLVQTAGGLDVVGGQVMLTVKFTAQGARLMDLDGRLYPDVTAPPQPALSLASAQSRAQSRLSSQGGGQQLKSAGAKIRWIKGRWRTVSEFSDAQQGLRVAVDGQGETNVWSERYYARDYQGSINGRGVHFDPTGTGDNLAAMPLTSLSFGLPGGPQTQTDPNGNFLLSNAPTPSPDISVALKGAWVNVINVGSGGNLVFSVPNSAPNPINLTFNPSGNAENLTSQVNAYVHTTRVHDYVASRGVDLPAINKMIPASVNINENCNAYYQASGINFFRSGSGCPNTAFDTVVYHEYGHYVDDMIGGIPSGGLSEGWGDLLAVYLTGQPVIGEDFFGAGSDLRTADNSYVYSPSHEIHDQGQAWAGFAWDLRKSLINSHGPTAGVALAENLVIPVFLANSPNIPAAVKQVAIRDDNDGDLSNGTPNFSAILAAAARHGVAGDLDFSEPTVSIQSPANGAVLTGVVAVSGIAGDNAGLVRVEVSVDGGAFSPAIGLTNWSFSLDTSMYVNGSHVITARAVDGGNNTKTHAITVQFNNPPVPGRAIYNVQYKTPACLEPGGVCDSGVLLLGRGSMTNGAEPNAPNTLFSACSDGSSGVFHFDESNDRIKVYTLDGGHFTSGKMVRVEATVWPFSGYNDDFLDIFVASDAANPKWTLLATLKPTGATGQVLTADYKLPEGAVQAVRAKFRYLGAATPSCGISGYDDQDDLVFAVDSVPLVSLTAAPNPVVIPAGHTLAASTITWNTLALPGGAQVRVSVDNAPWTNSGKFACISGPSAASQSAPWIQAGHTYEFRIYPDVTPACGDALPPTTHAASVIVKGIPANNAQFVSQVVPSVMTAGKSYPVSVTLKNTGGAPWGFVANHRLGSWNPADNTVWGLGRVNLATNETVAVDAQKTFFFNVTAPATPGNHTFQWRMLQEGIEFFGQASELKTIQVLAPDTALPLVSIVQPTAGATLSGLVAISGTASDNDVVSSVEIWVDGVLQGFAVGTTTWTFSLDSTLLANGAHLLTARATDASGNKGTLDRNVTVNNNLALYNGTLKAPSCDVPGAHCDSGALLRGRGAMFGTPEANQPNTLGSACLDGNSGTFHTDESNDKIRVVVLDGTPFAAGKAVRVEALVWAYQTFNNNYLDFYYTASATAPAWNYLATLRPQKAGAQVLSSTYTLPAGAWQAVRAQFRFNGSTDTCSAGNYNDRDDLAFAVASPTELSVAITTPTNGAFVSGDAVVVKAVGSSDLRGLQYKLDGEWLGAVRSSAPYALSWDTRDVANGTHTLTAVAWDMQGRSGTSTAVNVTVNNADTAPPGVPTGLQATGVSTGSIAVAWQPSTDNMGVVNYRLTYSSAADFTPAFAIVTPAAQTSLTLGGLSPSTTYYMRVAARDAAGNLSVDSATASAKTFAVNTPPVVIGTFTVAGVSANGGNPTFLKDKVGSFDPKQRWIVTKTPALAWVSLNLGGLRTITQIKYFCMGIGKANHTNIEISTYPAPTLPAHWTVLPGAQNINTGASAGWNSLSGFNHQAYWVRFSINNTEKLYEVGNYSEIMVLGVVPGGSGAADQAPLLSGAKAPQRFLSPALQDTINDVAEFGPEADEVIILDVNGRLIFQRNREAAGGFLVWNCRDDQDRMVGSGVYIARVKKTDGQMEYQSFIVVK